MEKMRYCMGKDADKCGIAGKSKKKRPVGEEKGINRQRKRHILVPHLSVKRKNIIDFQPFLLIYGHLWVLFYELTAELRRNELFYNLKLRRNGQIWETKIERNGRF